MSKQINKAPASQEGKKPYSEPYSIVECHKSCFDCKLCNIKCNYNHQVVKECFKKVRARAIDSRQRSRRESKISYARRMTREAQVFWKKYYSVEKSQRKRAEKQALVQRKLDDEIREVSGLYKSPL